MWQADVLTAEHYKPHHKMIKGVVSVLVTKIFTSFLALWQWKNRTYFCYFLAETCTYFRSFEFNL